MSETTAKTVEAKTRLRPNKSGPNTELCYKNKLDLIGLCSSYTAPPQGDPVRSHSFWSCWWVRKQGNTSLSIHLSNSRVSCARAAAAAAAVDALQLSQPRLELWCHCVTKNALPAVAQRSDVSTAAVHPNDVSTTSKTSYIRGATAWCETASIFRHLPSEDRDSKKYVSKSKLHFVCFVFFLYALQWKKLHCYTESRGMQVKKKKKVKLFLHQHFLSAGPAGTRVLPTSARHSHFLENRSSN